MSFYFCYNLVLMFFFPNVTQYYWKTYVKHQKSVLTETNRNIYNLDLTLNTNTHTQVFDIINLFIKDLC